MKFQIDTSVLSTINISDVKLDAASENKAAKELTINCGCGGTCLSSTT